MPLVIVSVLDQFVWEQAGIVTVSPEAAALMAVCTSLVLQDAAVRVVAFTLVPERATNAKTDRKYFIILAIRVVPHRFILPAHVNEIYCTTG
jgi:uridine phosphorylase